MVNNWEEFKGAVGVILEFTWDLILHFCGLCGFCAWITTCPRRILLKLKEWIGWGRDLVVELGLKILHLIIGAGLLAILPLLFILIMPLYARRFVCRFQAS